MTAIEMSLDYQGLPDCKDLKHIPGDDGLPLLGKALTLAKDTLGMVYSHVHKYGHLSHFRVGPHRGLMITHPNDLQEIFLDKQRNFSTKMGYSPIIGPFYKGAMLMYDWEEHKIQRRVLQNSFKYEAMKGYVEIMNPVLHEGITNWQSIADFHFFPHIKKMLIDVASRVFLGIEDLNGEENDRLARSFIDITEKGMMAIIQREIPGLPGLAFARGKTGQRYVENFIRSLIPIRRVGNGKDTMSLVVKEKDDDGQYWSEPVLISHLSFILFAAHDTTTSALNHLMMHLGKPENHHIQEELRQISQSMNKAVLDYDDLDNMVALDNCFLEALRLNPSIIMVPRRTIRECVLGGYRVPANTRLFLCPQWAHRDPSIWTNPDTFDPERFSPARAEHKKHAFGFMGFGGGAHKCIGMNFAKMQAKLFMHQLLLRYRFTTPENYNPTLKTVPLPKPGDNLPLKLTPL